MKKVSHEVVVRFRDLDSLGHVNYAEYLTYLEEAFNVLWVEALAADGKTFDVLNPGQVTVRSEVYYCAAALWRQILTVEMWVTSIDGSFFTTAYQILDKQSRKLLTEASTIQLVTIPGAERNTMPKKIQDALEAYLKK